VKLALRVSLFGLAPGGACRAAFLTVGAVVSYTTVSPLPSFAEASKGGLFSVALSLELLPAGVTRRRIRVEPGLSSSACAPAAVQPTGARDIGQARRDGYSPANRLIAGFG
jgi:hypothetical protein